jgi:hypothetical protein
MMGYDTMLIRVQAHWNDWNDAEIRLADLHAILHGYILCSRVVTGDLPHRCDTRSAPHRIFVCVLKRHTLSPVYSELIRRANAPSRCVGLS